MPAKNKAEAHGLSADQPSGKPGGGSDGRVAVTLSAPVAAATQRMGSQMGGVSKAEVVRRGLILLDLYLSLRDDQELVIWSSKTEQTERLHFGWDTF